MDTMEQEQDGLLMTGWAAPRGPAADPLGAAWALIVAQRNMILVQSETITGLEHRLAEAGERLATPLDEAPAPHIGGAAGEAPCACLAGGDPPHRGRWLRRARDGQGRWPR